MVFRLAKFKMINAALGGLRLRIGRFHAMSSVRSATFIVTHRFKITSVRSGMFILQNARSLHVAPDGAEPLMTGISYRHDAPTALPSTRFPVEISRFASR